MNQARQHPAYQAIRRFLVSRAGLAGAFVWGILEASIFFVVPDVYLGLVALFLPLFAFLYCGIIIAGALVGGGCMYFLARTHPEAMVRLLQAIPGISGKMISAVNTNFGAHGLKALFIAPWEGIPYKIFAVQAGMNKIDFIAFILLSIPARLERFILVLIVTALLGRIFRKSIARYPLRWTVFYILVWVGVYIRYAIFVRTFWGG